MIEFRWRLYLGLKWLAMAACPPGRRAMIEALEDAQADAFEAMVKE